MASTKSVLTKLNNKILVAEAIQCGSKNMWICICHPLTKQELFELIADNKVTEFNQLVDLTSASSGCGCCKEVLRQLFDQATTGNKNIS